MTKDALKYINDQLIGAGINYEFGEWQSDVKYPYFVGEYTESPPMSEDGRIEATFLLTGFSRGSWSELEEAKRKIEQLFNYNTSILPNGSGLDVSYAGAAIVPTTDAVLKRIQINLSIQEWRV